MGSQLVIYEEDHRRINAVCQRLAREVDARIVFLVDKNGQLIAAAGDVERVDTTSLASLTAGNIAATAGLARLIGEDREFAVLDHKGERESLHIAIICGRVILVIVYGQRSTIGFVQLRARKANQELTALFEALLRKNDVAGAPSPFADITEDDIENLFAD